jgi:hypothetical protein
MRRRQLEAFWTSASVRRDGGLGSIVPFDGPLSGRVVRTATSNRWPRPIYCLVQVLSLAACSTSGSRIKRRSSPLTDCCAVRRAGRAFQPQSLRARFTPGERSGAVDQVWVPVLLPAPVSAFPGAGRSTGTQTENARTDPRRRGTKHQRTILRRKRPDRDASDSSRVRRTALP